MHIALILLLMTLAIPRLSFSQDCPLVYDKMYNLPDKFFGAVNAKSDRFQQSVIRSTDKYLKKLYKRELKLQRRLAKKDSVAAKELFGDMDKRYDSLKTVLRSRDGKMQNVYSSHLDSMQTALNFFNTNKVLGQSPEMASKLEAVAKNYGDVQNKLNQTNLIQEQLTQHQQMLKKNLQNFGIVKELKKYQEEIYYYRAQLDEYKNIFERPQKLEMALLQIAKKIPSFSQYFNKYSQIGQLFQLPGSDLSQLPLGTGMQSRAMINESLEQRIGAVRNAQNIVSTNVDATKSALDRLKSRVNESGNSNNDLGMPEYKRNNEKIKALWKRIELGANVQNNRSNSFFPTTSDFGLSIGFKANARCIVGIGSSYRMGWGKNWRKITITHEGAGIRTFADWKLKGTFWLTGGWEMNHLSGFKNIEALKESDSWQTSALTGISKKFQFSKKTKAEIKLMYDFLWAHHHPTGQPIVFRMGYVLK